VAVIAKRSSESILRDQFALLVAERYDQLLVMTAIALGKREADELLPALRSSATSAARAQEAAEITAKHESAPATTP
jgi:hypothetical protein